MAHDRRLILLVDDLRIFLEIEKNLLERAGYEVITAFSGLEALEKTREQVERFRAEREEIERKLKVIDDLEKNRTGPVRVMDEIAMRIPKRVWLTELQMNAGQLKLEGMSLDAEIVAAFLTSLAESPLIFDVELETTRLEEKDGLKINTFEISSRYVHGEMTYEDEGGKKGRRKGKGKGRNRRRKKS